MTDLKKPSNIKSRECCQHALKGQFSMPFKKVLQSICIRKKVVLKSYFRAKIELQHYCLMLYCKNFLFFVLPIQANLLFLRHNFFKQTCAKCLDLLLVSIYASDPWDYAGCLL